MTGTEESDLSKTAAREGGWGEQDSKDLARENARADEEDTK